MHADLARLVPEEWTRRTASQPGVFMVSDGRWQGMRFPSVHWQLGRSLLDGIHPSPAGHAGVLAWYQETSTDLLKLRSLAEAIGHLARARQLFPADPSILFWSGVLHERFSSSAIQAAAASLVEDNRGKSELASARIELTRAERFFREAIAGDPDRLEARIRRGHVLGELERHEEAAAELRRAIAEGASGELLFFAQLFLGRQEEALGRLQAARTAFERAAELYPNAQSPKLALSQVARRAGDGEAARRALERLSTLPVDERRREDPWWRYYEVR